jgi:hypothetical protein
LKAHPSLSTVKETSPQTAIKSCEIPTGLCLKRRTALPQVDSNVHQLRCMAPLQYSLLSCGTSESRIDFRFCF